MRYLSLSFDPTLNLAQERAVLLTLESGRLVDLPGEFIAISGTT